MAKGSLHSHLQVALDTAKALSFLHEVHLIYRDFKSSNILLDTNYNAKLSNFGFVINGAEEDEISTSIAGTVGYFDPAYFRTGLPSKKSDVYGFGVVLLELISGKRVHGRYGPNENNLVEWAKPLLIDRKGIFEVMDSRIFYQYSDREAERIAHLAIQCLSEEQELRPTMDEVVRLLEHL
ncbi:hypothetical protein Fmac_014598 [Flemingia macrophylla]|uniref:Protein kinase domain-containing protein n=1 Tax=Flemingia macrophylla TaxID=520843 RepID=A0ABD1MC66_9FABA